MHRPLSLAILPSLLLNLLISPVFATSDASQIPMKERVYIASRVYAAFTANFAHSQGAPNVNVETAYRLYLDKALASDSRRAFSLATMEFLAAFHNGHTLLIDRELIRQPGPVPFVARLIERQWVVTASESPDLKPGDVIEKIDGRPFEQFFSEVRQYISASSEYSARHLLFSRLGDMAPYALLFPDSFELTLAKNRTVKSTGALLARFSPRQRKDIGLNQAKWLTSAFRPSSFLRTRSMLLN